MQITQEDVLIRLRPLLQSLLETQGEQLADAQNDANYMASERIAEAVRADVRRFWSAVEYAKLWGVDVSNVYHPSYAPGQQDEPLSVPDAVAFFHYALAVALEMAGEWIKDCTESNDPTFYRDENRETAEWVVALATVALWLNEQYAAILAR